MQRKNLGQKRFLELFNVLFDLCLLGFKLLNLGVCFSIGTLGFCGMLAGIWSGWTPKLLSVFVMRSESSAAPKTTIDNFCSEILLAKIGRSRLTLAAISSTPLRLLYSSSSLATLFRSAIIFLGLSKMAALLSSKSAIKFCIFSMK